MNRVPQRALSDPLHLKENQQMLRALDRTPLPVAKRFQRDAKDDEGAKDYDAFDIDHFMQLADKDPQKLFDKINAQLKGVHNEWKTKFNEDDMDLGNPAETKLEQALRQVVETGRMDPRSPVAQKFYADHKPGSANHSEFTKKKTHASKNEHKVEWAQTCLDTMETKKVHKRSFKKVDTTKGEHMPLGLLIEQFGIHYDRKSAIKCGMKHAEKCAKLTGDWIHYDNMSETLWFLFLKKQWQSEFEEAWTMLKTEMAKPSSGNEPSAEQVEALMDEGTGSAGDLPKAAGDEQASAANVASASNGTAEKGKGKAAKATRQAKGEGKGKGKAKGTGIEAGADNTRKVDIMATAQKLKKKFSMVTTTAQELVELINSGAEEWDWAANDKNVGRLQATMVSLREGVTEFGKKFLVQDVKTLKSMFGAAHLEGHLKQFISLESKVDKVEEERTRLLNRHKF